MLVLSRKQNETIKVGDVTFVIVMVGRGKVRVGIEAPKDTLILRGELEAAEQQEGNDEEHN